jgi:hypothetical protein
MRIIPSAVDNKNATPTYNDKLYHIIATPRREK